MSRISDLMGKIGVFESQAGTEVLGPLFGTSQDTLVTVRAVRVVPVHDLTIGREQYFGRAFERLLTTAKTDPELAPFELIGWCCIRSMNTKGLLESDTAFHNHRFPGSRDIALILRPEAQTSVSVELFARSPNGTISTEDHCRGEGTISAEIPAVAPIDLSMRPKVNTRVHTNFTKPADDGKKREGRGVTPASGPASSSFGLASVSLPRGTLPPLIVAVFLIAAAAATFVRLRQSRTVANVAKSLAAGSGVGLKVEAQQGDRLFVTWNRESPIVQSAKYGILHIDDGPQHKEIDFAPGEMQSGSILYRPASDQVTFRLQVLRPDDTLITESVHVLDGSMAVVMNTIAQKQPDVAAPQVTSTHGAERREPAKTFPVVAGDVVINHGNGKGTTVLTGGIVETSSLPKPDTSLPPPPKLSIATLPASTDTELTSLPKAPLPAAPREKPRSPETHIVNLTPSLPTPPRPLKQVLPDLRRVGVSEFSGIGQVEVDVSIDEAGHVTEARLLNPAKISKIVGYAAVQAARQWTFVPARMHGEAVSSEHSIIFQFGSKAQ